MPSPRAGCARRPMAIWRLCHRLGSAEAACAVSALGPADARQPASSAPFVSWFSQRPCAGTPSTRGMPSWQRRLSRPAAGMSMLRRCATSTAAAAGRRRDDPAEGPDRQVTARGRPRSPIAGSCGRDHDPGPRLWTKSSGRSSGEARQLLDVLSGGGVQELFQGPASDKPPPAYLHVAQVPVYRGGSGRGRR